MTGTNIQSDSSVIPAHLKCLGDGREEKGVTDITQPTPEHFKNQRNFNSNQIRKDLERHNKVVTTTLFQFRFFKRPKKKLKLKNVLKEKKKVFYTEQSIKSTFWGKDCFVVCTVHLYRRSTFASFGSNHSAAVKNKALKQHKL